MIIVRRSLFLCCIYTYIYICSASLCSVLLRACNCMGELSHTGFGATRDSSQQGPCHRQANANEDRLSTGEAVPITNTILCVFCISYVWFLSYLQTPTSALGPMLQPICVVGFILKSHAFAQCLQHLEYSGVGVCATGFEGRSCVVYFTPTGFTVCRSVSQEHILVAIVLH